MRAVLWELHVGEDRMAKIESYLAVVSSLAHSWDWVNPLSLPATNTIKQSREGLQDPVHCSF